VDAFAAVQKLAPLPAIFFSADAGESEQVLPFQQAAGSSTQVPHALPCHCDNGKRARQCAPRVPPASCSNVHDMAAVLTEHVRAPSAAAGDKCTWHKSSADGALSCRSGAPQPCGLCHIPVSRAISHLPEGSQTLSCMPPCSEGQGAGVGGGARRREQGAARGAVGQRGAGAARRQGRRQAHQRAGAGAQGALLLSCCSVLARRWSVLQPCYCYSATAIGAPCT
jgi:hypothetical protein